jgi:hypothetical protein
MKLIATFTSLLSVMAFLKKEQDECWARTETPIFAYKDGCYAHVKEMSGVKDELTPCTFWRITRTGHIVNYLSDAFYNEGIFSFTYAERNANAENQLDSRNCIVYPTKLYNGQALYRDKILEDAYFEFPGTFDLSGAELFPMTLFVDHYF